MKIDLLIQNSVDSLLRVLIGVFAAFMIGILLGFFRSSLPSKIKKNSFIKILFEILKFPPPIAWIPFVILFAGIGNFSSIIIVFIGAVSPILTSSFDAAESLPEILKSTAKTLEIKGFQFYLKIIFPFCLPRIFTGLRSAVSMGWMSVIAAEMVSGQSGLGYSIQLNRLNLNYQFMMVDMAMIAVIGYFLFSAVGFLEKKMIRWKPA